MGIVKLDLVPRYSRPVVAKETDMGNIKWCTYKSIRKIQLSKRKWGILW